MAETRYGPRPIFRALAELELIDFRPSLVLATTLYVVVSLIIVNEEKAEFKLVESTFSKFGLVDLVHLSDVLQP